jgi:hypothetical protein
MTGGRAIVPVVVLVAALTSCRGKPRPTYEYEPTVTITSGDPPPPAAPAEAADAAPSAAASTTTLPPPARPSAWRRGEKQ